MNPVSCRTRFTPIAMFVIRFVCAESILHEFITIKKTLLGAVDERNLYQAAHSPCPTKTFLQRRQNV
jgi:hypothetical protein